MKIKITDKKLCIETRDGIYKNNGRNREILTVHWQSKYTETAIVIGINPSKANNSRSDLTLTKLGRFLDQYGYCRFEMLNIFTSYATYQEDIVREDITIFENYRSKFHDTKFIFIVWGVGNQYQEEKNNVLAFLRQYREKIYCFQNLKGTSPIHPSRMSYAYNIISYPFESDN